MEIIEKKKKKTLSIYKCILFVINANNTLIKYYIKHWLKPKSRQILFSTIDINKSNLSVLLLLHFHFHFLAICQQKETFFLQSLRVAFVFDPTQFTDINFFRMRDDGNYLLRKRLINKVEFAVCFIFFNQFEQY